MKTKDNHSGVIYKCVNTINGKIYIGQTIRSFNAYCREHIRYALNKTDLKYGHKRKFYHALRKYGVDKFLWKIIEYCPREQLNKREIYWIAFYDSFKNGYNTTKGGYGCLGTSPYKRTHAIRQKIARALKGHKRTKDSIQKQIKSMSGSSHPLFGVGHKQKSIEKMRRSKKGLNNPNAKIFEFISPNGDVFIVKAGFNKFCSKNHLWHNAMTEVHRGLKKEHKGWKCRYIKATEAEEA